MFIERGYSVDCYIDYDYMDSGRCHVYSLPFDIDCICDITYGFPGGMSRSVRVLSLKDFSHSFEHGILYSKRFHIVENHFYRMFFPVRCDITNFNFG